MHQRAAGREKTRGVRDSERIMKINDKSLASPQLTPHKYCFAERGKTGAEEIAL